jgi:hypothetical protein
MQKLYNELKDRGLEILAVNSNDGFEVVRKYIAEGKFTFLMGLEFASSGSYAPSKRYGVQAYPTNYILDSEGKVVYRSTGFDEKAIRAALEKLGVK